MLQASRKILFPFIVPKIYTTYFQKNNSVMLRVSLSKPGAIYCNVLQDTVSLTSVQQVTEVRMSALLTSTNLNNTIFLFPNLVAGHNYYIYCYTEDFLGHAMTVSDVKSTAVYLETANCCRKITLNFDADVYVSTVFSPILSFSLDALPVSYIMVALTIRSCTPGPVLPSSSMPTISPANFDFDSTSHLPYGNFTIISNNINVTGCFVLNVSTAAKGITDILYTSDERVIQIQDRKALPPTPRMTSITMSGDGRLLIGKFDMSTDMGSMKLDTLFVCHSMLRFTKSTATNCYWSSSSTLIANIYEQNAVKVGDSILFVGRPVKAVCPVNSAFDCSKLFFSTFFNGRVQIPFDPVQPEVVLVAPLQISSCDELSIDPTMSSGNGNSIWKDVTWTIQCVGQRANLTGMQTYFNGFKSTSSVINVPNNLIWRKYPFYIACNLINIELQLTNTFNQVGIGSASVAISKNNDVPKALIAAPSSNVRWKPLVIYGAGSFSTCGSTLYDLTYVWKIYHEGHYLPNILSSSTDPTVLKLDPYVLRAGSVYSIQLIVTLDSNKAVQTSALTRVLIGPTPLIVRFYGWSSRNVSVQV